MLFLGPTSKIVTRIGHLWRFGAGCWGWLLVVTELEHFGWLSKTWSSPLRAFNSSSDSNQVCLFCWGKKGVELRPPGDPSVMGLRVTEIWGQGNTKGDILSWFLFSSSYPAFCLQAVVINVWLSQPTFNRWQRIYTCCGISVIILTHFLQGDVYWVEETMLSLKAPFPVREISRGGDRIQFRHTEHTWETPGSRIRIISSGRWRAHK